MGWVSEFEFQWVLDIKSAAPAETSTQVQEVFLQSPPMPTRQSICILKSLPSKSMDCKRTPSRKQMKGESVGDVFAAVF